MKPPPPRAAPPVSPRDPETILADQADWARLVDHRARHHRFVGTLPFHKSPLWMKHVRTIDPRTPGTARWTGRFGIPDAGVIARLIREAPKHDLVFLNGGERADLVYLAIAGLMPWIRTPHVIVDAHWHSGGRLKRLGQRLLLRLGRRLLAQVQPHSAEEIPIYRDMFGIPPDRVHPIPWSDSLTGYDRCDAARDGDYVLTGGFSYRDYDTFLPAAGRLGLPVRIGIPAADVPAGLAEQVARYPNIQLFTDWTFAEYWRQVAGCRVFAMPIQADLTRCTADQTMLSAMALARVVIATDAISSRLYLEDGVNGFRVPATGVDAWAERLGAVWNWPQAQRQAIGCRARETVRIWFNEPWRIARTLDAAVAILDSDHARLPAAPRVKPPRNIRLVDG